MTCSIRPLARGLSPLLALLALGACENEIVDNYPDTQALVFGRVTTSQGEPVAEAPLAARAVGAGGLAGASFELSGGPARTDAAGRYRVVLRTVGVSPRATGVLISALPPAAAPLDGAAATGGPVDFRYLDEPLDSARIDIVLPYLPD